MALKRKSAYFISLLAILLVSLHNQLRADEGMWLISLISRNMEQMQNMGLKLSAEDIYSVNKSCLKDAVVLLDDGSCSAEIISPNGLVL
nr:S46 family peptidase [Tenuifilaceae bacterium]